MVNLLSKIGKGSILCKIIIIKFAQTTCENMYTYIWAIPVAVAMDSNKG